MTRWGHLLGLYALLAPFEWRADDLDKCSGCRTKDCIAGRNHYRLVGRSCTSNLYPAKIKDNRRCLLCTQCLKSCPYKNLRFSLRMPCRDMFGSPVFTWAQMVFLLVVAAFVVYEILSEWSSSKAVLTWIPAQVARLLAVDGAAASLLSAVVMFVFYPAVFLGCVYLLIALTITLTIFLKSALFRQHGLPVRIGVFLAAGVYWAVFAVTIVLWRF